MRRLLGLLAMAVLSLGSAALFAAADTATHTVTAVAQVAGRSSLVVSNQVLRFSVQRPAEPAVATVDFVAAVRTQAGAEVVMTVEADTAQVRLTADTRLTFSDDSDATVNGALTMLDPAVAARWIGSGRRTGRIAFALHGAATGTYTIPVRFVLSVP